MDQRLPHNDNDIPLAFRKAREIGLAPQDPAAEALRQRLADRLAAPQHLESDS